MLKTRVSKLVEKGINLQLFKKKKHGNFKNQNNFLNLKLSTVWFEAALLVSLVLIKLKEVMGSSEKEEAKVADHFLLRGKIPGGHLLSYFRSRWGIFGRLSVQLLITAKFERLWVAPICNKYYEKNNDQRLPNNL